MTATPTPDPEARCPDAPEFRVSDYYITAEAKMLAEAEIDLCGNFQFGRKHAIEHVAQVAQSLAARVRGIYETDRAHALASASALLREAREHIGAAHKYIACCQKILHWSLTGIHEHDDGCLRAKLLTRIDRELAKEAM